MRRDKHCVSQIPMPNDSICLSYGWIPPVKLTVDEEGIWKRRNNGRRQGTSWDNIYRVDLAKAGVCYDAIMQTINILFNSNPSIQKRKYVLSWIHIYFNKDGNKYRFEIVPHEIRCGPDWHPSDCRYGEKIVGTCANIIKRHVNTDLVHEYRLSKGYFKSAFSRFKAKRKLRWENQNPK